MFHLLICAAALLRPTRVSMNAVLMKTILGAACELSGAMLCKRVHKMVVYISAIIKPPELAVPTGPRY
jgi:hypothetical protein